MASLSEAMLAEAAICAGSSFGSGELVSDPSVTEQPPSAIAANAITAVARRLWRNLAEKTPIIGIVIVQDTQAFTLLLVACSVVKCIGQIAV
jgi:hypothetical protein